MSGFEIIALILLFLIAGAVGLTAFFVGALTIGLLAKQDNNKPAEEPINPLAMTDRDWETVE